MLRDSIPGFIIFSRQILEEEVKGGKAAVA
jgi:hypothetical protein